MLNATEPETTPDESHTTIEIYMTAGYARDEDVDTSSDRFRTASDLRAFGTDAFEAFDHDPQEAVDTALDQLGDAVEIPADEFDSTDGVLQFVYGTCQGGTVSASLPYDGSKHRSLSVGDVIVVDDTPYMVDRIGFTELDVEVGGVGDEPEAVTNGGFVTEPDGTQWCPECQRRRLSCAHLSGDDVDRGDSVETDGGGEVEEADESQTPGVAATTWADETMAPPWVADLFDVPGVECVTNLSGRREVAVDTRVRTDEDGCAEVHPEMIATLSMHDEWDIDDVKFRDAGDDYVVRVELRPDHGTCDATECDQPATHEIDGVLLDGTVFTVDACGDH